VQISHAGSLKLIHASGKCEVKIRQIKAPIAGNSLPIGKIDNAELADFNE
jgi:hypothetical protein